MGELSGWIIYSWIALATIDSQFGNDVRVPSSTVEKSPLRSKPFNEGNGLI
jgi:hypothetical protein